MSSDGVASPKSKSKFEELPKDDQRENNQTLNGKAAAQESVYESPAHDREDHEHNKMIY